MNVDPSIFKAYDIVAFTPINLMKIWHIQSAAPIPKS